MLGKKNYYKIKMLYLFLNIADINNILHDLLPGIFFCISSGADYIINYEKHLNVLSKMQNTRTGVHIINTLLLLLYSNNNIELCTCVVHFR